MTDNVIDYTQMDALIERITNNLEEHDHPEN